MSRVGRGVAAFEDDRIGHGQVPRLGRVAPCPVLFDKLG